VEGWFGIVEVGSRSRRVVAEAGLLRSRGSVTLPGTDLWSRGAAERSETRIEAEGRHRRNEVKSAEGRVIRRGESRSRGSVTRRGRIAVARERDPPGDGGEKKTKVRGEGKQWMVGF